MNDSCVPSKRILRPHFIPGAGGLSGNSSPDGQVKIKIKKHKLLSTTPRTFTLPTATLSTTLVKKEQPKKLFSIFKPQHSKGRHDIPLAPADLGNKPPPKTILQLMQPKGQVQCKSVTIPPVEHVTPLPPTSTRVNQKRQAERAPWPDQRIFKGGHIRQYSAPTNNAITNPMTTRIPNLQMDTLLKTQGRAYLDSMKQQRLLQQTATTVLPIQRADPYETNEIIKKMDGLYPSGWRSSACEHLLDRRNDIDEGQWCDKYRPSHTDGLLDNKPHHDYLRDWLERQKVTNNMTRNKDLNMVLLVGSHGVGKTASVFTAAQETGYRVFEIHPGVKRSLKDVVRLVGDMTKNHLVRFDGDGESQEALVHYGQSVVLLEEVDLVYQSDKGFWNAVCDLARSSKRPIILTCNDTSVVQFGLLSLQAVLRYQPPRSNLLVPYLHLVCLLEGYDISRDELTSWVNRIGLDLRQLLMTLEYLHHQPYTPSQPMTHDLSPIIQAHMNLLVKPWLCKSDPGTQVTPLCMQLIQNDTGSQTGSEDDLDLFTLQVWLNNRSLIDAGVGMTEKRISQVYGLDDYYGANLDDHECGYLHSWKTPGGWDHLDTEAYMEETLLEWNHLQEGNGLADIMAWQHVCDQRRKQKEDNLLFVLPSLNYRSNSFGVWRNTFLDISYGEQLESLRQGRTALPISIINTL